MHQNSHEPLRVIVSSHQTESPTLKPAPIKHAARLKVVYQKHQLIIKRVLKDTVLESSITRVWLYSGSELDQ